MQRLEVSGTVRPIYGSLGVKRLNIFIDTVVFDYIPFPVFTHTTGMTHFQNVMHLIFPKKIFSVIW